MQRAHRTFLPEKLPLKPIWIRQWQICIRQKPALKSSKAHSIKHGPTSTIARLPRLLMASLFHEVSMSARRWRQVCRRSEERRVGEEGVYEWSGTVVWWCDYVCYSS